MEHTSYIQNLFYSFLQNVNTLSENLMFIKHYNTLDLSLEKLEKIVCDEYKNGLLYHGFSKNVIKEPYEPFMSGIRYYYQKFYSKDLSVEEFIDECDIYSLHKQIFETYIKTGKATRFEMLIIAESKFEKDRFIDSIINTLDYISRTKKILIVLNNFQYSSITTIDILERMINNSEFSNVKIMIVYSELQQPLLYIENKYMKVIECAEEKNILFEWDEEEKCEVSKFHLTFVPNKRFFSDYLRKLNNLYEMFAYEDAKHFIDIIHERISEGRLIVSDLEKFDFYYISSLCEMMLNDENNALLMADKLLELYDRNKDFLQDYRYNLLCGRIHMKLCQADLTIKKAEKAKEAAKKLGDDDLYFTADIVSKGAYFGGFKDVFVVDFENICIDEEFISKLREYGYLNTLAHYLIYAKDNDVETIEKFIKNNSSDSFEEAVAISTRLNNSDFLQTAYTKYIVKFTDNGYHKYIEEFYKKKFEILDRSGENVRIAHLYLGMGYNAIISEKYAKANEYFVKAIEYLFKLKRVEELIEAVYNLSINCICAEDYMSSCDYLNALFKMLDNMNLQTIQICNASKLYGLLSLSFFKLGNDYRALRCLDSMENLLSHVLYAEEHNNIDVYKWQEDLFLYYMLVGMLAKKNEDYEKAGICFSKAKKYFEVCSNVMFYSVGVFIVEYYDYFLLVGDEQSAEEILKYGVDFCEKNGYILKSKTIISQIEKKTFNTRPLVAGFVNVSLGDLIKISYNAGVENNLDKRRKDIRFLSVWQEMLNKEYSDTELLINNAMITLQNNFNFNGILALEIKDNQIKELYKDIEIDSNYSYKDIKDFFMVIKRDFITSRTDKSYVEYDKLVSIFGERLVVTCIGVPVYDEEGLIGIFVGIITMSKNLRFSRTLMNEEDLVIVKTAINQLFTSIERVRNKFNIIEINKKLNELAVTDMLTGLYNRQGLTKMIESYSNKNSNIIILYADLDNFKYYNDTFGHDLGDVILKRFSKVISDICEGIGFAVRYGGDEFLLILEDVDLEKS
ncbi:MAG: diguanylate cyclase [Lachnospiraceae bacterium]|nr:diguanylate cyclase [Lachnospiraceae bacterium]